VKIKIALFNICLAFIFLLIIIINVTSKGTLYSLDYELAYLLKGLVNPTNAMFMTNFIDYFDKYIIGGLSGAFLIYLLVKKEWWNLLVLFLSVGGGGVLIVYLQMFFRRWRPMEQIIAGRGYAFPSGHAFFAMVIFGFMIFLARTFIKSNWLQSLIYSLCIFLILLIGISLIFLNDHWFSEVLGGYCAGFSWLLISILLIRILRDHWQAEERQG
jgi:undecaprenyl-diphosphatase